MFLEGATFWVDLGVVLVRFNDVIVSIIVAIKSRVLV